MRTRMAFIFTMALGGAFIAAPMAWADGSRCSGGNGHMLSRHPGDGHDGSTGHMLRYLLKHKEHIGLSDDQIAKLRRIALDADRTGIRAGADKMVSDRELRAMMWDAQADLPAIEAKVKETELLEAAVRIIRIRAKRELMAVLTPEQKTKLTSLRSHQRYSGHDRMRTEAGMSPDGASPMGAAGDAGQGRSQSPGVPSAG